MEYCFPGKLNIEAMKKASKYFEGEHDFKAFKASGTSSKSSTTKYSPCGGKVFPAFSLFLESIISSISSLIVVHHMKH